MDTGNPAPANASATRAMEDRDHSSNGIGGAMYSLGLQREFVTRHYLIGGDWGAENELHPHAYRIEVRLETDSLGPHGFIVDLVELETELDSTLGRYRDQTLNELPQFDSLNPSLEHFARILCQDLASGLGTARMAAIQVTLWEDASAWAAYRMEV